MDLKSNIGYQKEDGTFETVYCHKGTLKENFTELSKYFTSVENVKLLTNAGNMKIIGYPYEETPDKELSINYKTKEDTFLYEVSYLFINGK